MAAPKSAGAPQSPQPDRQARKGPRRYFIVNPAGAVHEVDREHAAWRLKQPGYRLATADEVAALERQGGHQTSRKPIAAAYNPTLDDDDDGPELG